MKNRPILYSPPMVRALLADLKTQTRRIAKLTVAGHAKEVGGHRRWQPPPSTKSPRPNTSSARPAAHGPRRCAPPTTATATGAGGQTQNNALLPRQNTLIYVLPTQQTTNSTMKTQCPHCKQEFQRKSVQKFCSAECAFWSRVKIKNPNECWEWVGSRQWQGYGEFSFEGTHHFAHRFSMLIKEGPSNLDVIHSCDNPPCCNPNHITYGTHKENMEDMCSKGRHVTKKGEEHYRARLTSAQVSDIRRLAANETKTKIASLFGVGRTTISAIVNNRNWRI